MLKQNNSQVRKSATERTVIRRRPSWPRTRPNLGAALSQLATALGQVQTFIQDNREPACSTMHRPSWSRSPRRMVDQRASLAELLDTVHRWPPTTC